MIVHSVHISYTLTHTDELHGPHEVHNAKIEGGDKTPPPSVMPP